MNTSCIEHPSGEQFIIIRKWQLDVCEGNACAAALLSFFEYWHNIKLAQQQQAHAYNNVAEMHGDARSQYEGLLQWHTTEEIERGILIYRRESIRRGIALLERLGFISIHPNPNPKYRVDKTRYFLFHPEMVQAAIANRSANPNNQPPSPNNEPPSPKNGSPSPKNGSPSPIFGSPSPIFGRHTKNTYIDTNKENKEITPPYNIPPQDLLWEVGASEISRCANQQAALSEKPEKNVSPPALEQFLSDFRLYAPASWVKPRSLTKTYQRALNSFIRRIGGDPEMALEIFRAGLQFAAQDKFYQTCDWDLANFLTNEKPERFAAKWGQIQEQQDYEREQAQILARRDMPREERHRQLLELDRKYGKLPDFWDEVIAKVQRKYAQQEAG